MDHFQQIYSRRAAEYHRMISVEDCEQNLITALQAITPLQGKQVVDLGTGTGRIPILLDQIASKVIGVDLYANMLEQNRLERAKVNGHWHLAQADMRRLPLADHSADVVTAGWSIGHFRSWFNQDWQAQISRVIEEMLRIAKPGGWLIILETLTTGSLKPAPPTPELAEYYHWLEEDWGFTQSVIRTDYTFTSVEDAIENTEFFFGAPLAELIRENGWSRLPEWTGIWSKHID